MREIIFRGKAKKGQPTDCDWVYGDLIHYKITDEAYPYTRTCIKDYDTGFEFEVDPETICEFTGSYDNLKKRIWENDFVEITCKYKNKVEFEQCGCVEYKDTGYVLNIFTSDENFDFPIYKSYCNDEREDTFIVIGNRLNNPEILKENK